ncbi:ABC transporter ATP-binding protein, partial [Burkholderia gladioli]
MNENGMMPDLAQPDGGAEALTLSGVASMARVVEPGAIDTSHGTILYLEDVEVSFDGFRALRKLSLSIDAGELR